MSYLALYRAFRPKTFDQIVGQEHIVRTLVNQIKNDKTGHAYLFTGARGTGKTTAAKVFARAINCLSPVNGSPCGECEVCKKLENPSNLDILEMDAASNNKVENIRDIRDKIQYPPVAGRYKVYIIDEVHMLTTEAFNALLKTLEEPPAHAVFILATTEVHKIPATILSRCLRFDFKLVPTPVIADTIAKIYDKIGKKYTKEAVSLIAKAGEGSVRDALSVADICVSFSDGELTYDDVLEVLGASDREKIEQLIGGIIAGDTGKILTLVDDLLSRGKSVSVLNRDVCSALRDLLVIKTCTKPEEILNLPADKLKELKALADKTDVHALLRYVEIFAAAEADLKYSTHPKIVFETAAVKAGMPQADYNIDALMGRISKLEEQLKNALAGNISVNLAVAPVASSVSKSADNGVIAADLNKTNEVLNAAKPEMQVSKPIAAQEEKPAKKVLVEGVDLPEIPAEEDGFAFESYAKPLQKEVVPDIPEKKSSVKAVSSKSVSGGETKAQPSGNAERAWGAVLRKMRQDKEIMLWAACDDVTAGDDGKTFVLYASGENEYTFLSKPENIAKLKNYVLAEGYDDIRLVADKSEVLKNEQADEQVEAVKKAFEGEKITIK